MVMGLGFVSVSGSGLGLGGLVERTFWRIWSRCPLSIGMDLGAWRRKVSTVRPGKLVKKLLSSANSKVDKAGEYRVAWAYVTDSAIVVPPSLLA